MPQQKIYLGFSLCIQFKFGLGTQKSIDEYIFIANPK